MKARQIHLTYNQKEIQKRVEKTFKRLMVAFLKFQGDYTLDSVEVQDKIKELNDEWCAYCTKMGSNLLPDAPKVFMEHINETMEKLKSVSVIPMAPEDPPPIGTTPSEKLQ